jgi:SAM-dependent methyltransferase
MKSSAANDNLPVDPAATIAALLRRRAEVSDEAFDSLLTELPRKKSRTYWSSVEAAQTASRLLREAGATQVLDAGSGVGKFCAIASLDLAHRVWGVERRGELVFESRRLAQVLGAEVVIQEGTLHDVDASEFDGFYFFNPFGEYVAADEDRYDMASPRSFDAYIRDARLVEKWLRAAPVGTAMVTYNGLGGRIPVSYRVRHTTHVRDDTMRLWVKEKLDSSFEAYIEIEEELITASELARLAATNGAGFADSPLVRELSTFIE